MPALITLEKSTPSRNLRNIIRGLVMLCLILGIGVAGYMYIEGWTPFESLYMTVITITTVGFRELREVSEAGRVFTVALIFMGMGVMAYTVGAVAQMMVETQVSSILGRRKLTKELKKIKNHYIVCGYGRIGSIIARELNANQIPVVIIDGDAQLEERMVEIGVPYIIADATNEDILMEAGIERAKGLVTVVHSDADNLFITMTARGLKPDLFILSRTDTEASERKLLRAGANRVVRPYLIGGLRMVHTIIRPAVIDFIDFTMQDKNIELKMEELRVDERSRLNGVSLLDSGIRQEMNVIIVAIRNRKGEMTFNPASDARISAGETLIALGPKLDLKQLEKILSGG
jgi:voltage-gated potassium channel